ncbi:MAG: hypothetical protein QMC62_03970 [Alteromonadaceae bacterium]
MQSLVKNLKYWLVFTYPSQVEKIMPTNNIICLGVNELYLDKQLHPYKATLPNLCFFEFTQEIHSAIDETKNLLCNHNFHEISFQTNTVNWFFKLTNRYHHDITTFIHINEKAIHFSGKMRSFENAHFRTPEISINQLEFNQIPIKPIRMSQLKEPLTIGLITKIKNLNKQYKETEDLYYGIEPLINELQQLDEQSAMDLHLHCDSQLDLIKRQGCELMSKMQTLEMEMLSLSRVVLHKVFGVSKGDWISYLPADSASFIQLQYEYCDIYECTLAIRGPGITKKGELGKREQAISIELMGKE